MAVLQLSFRCVGTSSRAMLGVPHWLGQGTGYRGHWYWWFWGQRLGVIGVERRRGVPIPVAPSHLDGVEDKLLGAVGAGLGALGALRQGVLGQQAPHHARPTLVLTVHAFLGTCSLVALGTEPVWLLPAPSPRPGCALQGAPHPACPHVPYYAWQAPFPQPGCAPSSRTAPSVPYSPTTSSVATVTPRCSPTPRYPPHHTPFPHIPHSIPVLTLSPSGAHLEGLPGEVPGAELALDAAFGAAVLQVLGQIAAAQFGAAAVGAGDDVEAAGTQVGLGEGGAQGWSGLGVRGDDVGCSLPAILPAGAG